MPGKSIAVNRGTLEDSSLTEAAPPSADIKRFDNYNSVIQAFLSGQAQLMAVGNDVGAQVLARQVTLKPEQKFQLMTSPDHIALNKNEPRLKQALERHHRQAHRRRHAQQDLGEMARQAARSQGPLSTRRDLSMTQDREPFCGRAAIEAKRSNGSAPSRRTLSALVSYVLDFGWLSEALEPILRGALATIFLTAVTGVLGTIFSILGAAAARSRFSGLRGAVDAYVELIRNTPFLVQLFFIFFGLPSLGLRLDATRGRHSGDDDQSVGLRHGDRRRGT